MFPSLESQLSAGRDHYLNFYRSAIRDYRKRFNPSAPEVMVERTAATCPVPYRYYRLDMASGAVSPPDFTEVNVEAHGLFEPLTFAPAADLKVTLHPFVWNGIEIVSRTAPAKISALTDWVNRWLDDGDTKRHDADGLSEVIHSVTFPGVVNSRWTFSVDFGSAPVTAFDELPMTLGKLGITAVSVGSFTFLGPEKTKGANR